MVLGYAVCNGHRFDVLGIELREGCIVFCLQTCGPGELEGPITVFGSDGQGLFQGSFVPYRQLWRHEWIRIEIKLRSITVEIEDLAWY